MRWCLAVLVVLGFLFGFCRSAGAEGEKEPAKPRKTERFVVVVVDGLDAGYVDSDTAPNINGIGAAGVRVNKVSGVIPATPEAAVATLLTGVGPDRHGADGAGDRVAVPTLSTLLEKRNEGTAFFVAGGIPVSGLTEKTVQTAADDASLMRQVIASLKENRPYLTVVVLRGPRTALAKGGAGGQEYQRAVTAADTQVGRLLRSLHAQGVFENTFICITGTTPKPPLILKAPEVKTGAALPPAALLDLAPTLGSIMGVNLPDPDGQVLWNAFASAREQTAAYLLELRVKDLSKSLFKAREELQSLLQERVAVEREKGRVRKQQQEMDRELTVRDARIAQLEKTIGLLKAAILVILGLCGIGYVYEYRFLRRRFLLFK